MKRIIRSTTISLSLNTFCKGVLSELKDRGYNVLAVSAPDDGLYELEKREGVRVEGVSMERHISPLKDLASFCKLVKVFCKEKPDMVHSMTPKAGLLCMMAAWMARVPVRVHTFTGLVWPTSTGMTRRILMATDWITCACATHVIPEGYGVMEDLQKHITKKPMRVLGYGNVRGIDLSYWRNSKEKIKSERGKELKSCLANPNSESPFTFLFVGRIVGDKGINELVSAFQRLLTQMKKLNSETVKKCRLVLVGRFEDDLDPISTETRQMIDSMPEIMAVGPQYSDDLLAWYAACDCFVFPSYREGYPNTVIEAGAMEVPCIVTDINGSREIICNPNDFPAANYELRITNYKPEDRSEATDAELRNTNSMSALNQRLNPGERMSIRENGVVIPSKDADALYEAMMWMMDHQEERETMGKRAREIVAERWEQGYVRQCLFDFYREVLGEPS